MTFMKIKSVSLVAAIALGCSSVQAAQTAAVVKGSSAGSATRSVPRPTPPTASEGARDLTGVWARYPAPWPSFMGDFEDIPPPDLGPDLDEPYATQWKEKRTKRLDAFKAGKPLIDPSTKCLPEGMPGVMLGIYPIQILQTPGQITVLAEIFMQTRRIYMDQPMPPLDELAPTYYGFSTGHWEVDLLVINTQGIRKYV